MKYAGLSGTSEWFSDVYRKVQNMVSNNDAGNTSSSMYRKKAEDLMAQKPHQGALAASPATETIAANSVLSEEALAQATDFYGLHTDEEVGVLVSKWEGTGSERWVGTEFEQLGAKLHELHKLLLDNVGYFSGKDNVHMTQVLMAIVTDWGVLEEAVLHVCHAAPRHDADPSTPGNGYRSLITVVDICICKILRRLRHCCSQRTSLLFNTGSSLIDLREYSMILNTLRKMLQYAVLTDTVSRRDTLFIPAEEAEIEAQAIASFHQFDCSCFYGRRVAFYYDVPIRRAFIVIISAMAGYGAAFHRQDSKSGKQPKPAETHEESLESVLRKSRESKTLRMQANLEDNGQAGAGQRIMKNGEKADMKPEVFDVRSSPPIQSQSVASAPTSHNQDRACSQPSPPSPGGSAAHCQSTTPIDTPVLPGQNAALPVNHPIGKVDTSQIIEVHSSRPPPVPQHVPPKPDVISKPNETSRQLEEADAIEQEAKAKKMAGPPDIIGGARAVMHGVGCFLSPAARAESVVERFRTCDIAFAKGFWGLTEAPIAQHTGPIVSPWMSVNQSIKIPITEEALLNCYNDGPLASLTAQAVTLPVCELEPVEKEFKKLVDAKQVSEIEEDQLLKIFAKRKQKAVSPVQPATLYQAVRSLSGADGDGKGCNSDSEPESSDLRTRLGNFTQYVVTAVQSAGGTKAEEDTGLGWVNTQLLSFDPPPTGEGRARRGLVLHFHGGGFVAQSPRSHEVYLRHWTKLLKVPILSVDYSLAPAAYFPRAVDECYHVYCWAIKNRQKLGAGEQGRIIVTGDSAGGNLAVAVALKAAQAGIRMPDGVVCSYPVLNVKLAASPSRMLALMDSLLPLGILECCLRAYAGPRMADTTHPLMSPIYAPDELLRLLCPVHIVAAELDPLLDDSVAFIRRLRALGHDAHLDVVDKMPHGFLNLAYLGGGDCMIEASSLVVERLSQLLSPPFSNDDKDAVLAPPSVSTQSGKVESQYTDHFSCEKPFDAHAE
ncbi:hypothetical protein DIPPA_52145 [Diplonema papillatum]|nr:hypothetical protein DIPPA_52145 [Diplonema papillatum]